MPEHEFLTASKFYFEADSITEKIIKEVSGLSVESTPAQATRQATPTVAKFTNITLKLVATTDLDLYKWYEDCNKNMGEGSTWSEKRKSASVSAYDQSNKMQARWEIVKCYPCKYTGPTLTASSGDMATETIELVHEGIKRVQ
jgi:phage tail-like protein